MTDVGVMISFRCCMNNDCENCDFKDKDDCQNELRKAVLATMKLQKNSLDSITETLNRLEKEYTELKEKVSVSYTLEQLVEAVNDIIDSFLNCEEYDDHTEAQLLAIGSFMRLVRLHGHIAVNCNADRMEIRLDK